MEERHGGAAARREIAVLIAAIFIAGLCSIVYELLISTASSYFLGDSIKQFSITIGLYMAAMGAGAYLSRLLTGDVLPFFVALEIGLGFLGGISIPLLYLCYSVLPQAYTFAMVVLILAIGVLIGFEIPLLTRILERYYTLKLNISNVLTMDYLGALVATLMFPFFLLPVLGTFRSGLIFGTVNMGIGFLVLWAFRGRLPRGRSAGFRTAAIAVAVFLMGLLVGSQFLIRSWSRSLYEDRIIFSRQTPYQKLVLTRRKDDLRLFIDGNLQFSSIDEYRYHEVLVHVPMALAGHGSEVLILGGGDGLAARELLKYPQIRRIRIVDIDPAVTDLGRTNPLLSELNARSLWDERVEVVHQDAWVFLAENAALYDLILADLPDPNNVSLARFYSREFYAIVAGALARDGVFVTQATSPFFAREAFWCVRDTLAAASGFAAVRPYHAYVPSFGDWGFIVALKRPRGWEEVSLSVPTRFLDGVTLRGLFHFEKDLAEPEAGEPVVSTLDHPSILDLYLKGWRHWH